MDDKPKVNTDLLTTLFNTFKNKVEKGDSSADKEERILSYSEAIGILIVMASETGYLYSDLNAVISTIQGPAQVAHHSQTAALNSLKELLTPTTPVAPAGKNKKTN